MSRTHLIEAVCFVLIWLLAYGLFFRNDMFRWLRERGPRRRQAAEAERRKTQAQTRLRDELAAKYPVPPSAQPPRR